MIGCSFLKDPLTSPCILHTHSCLCSSRHAFVRWYRPLYPVLIQAMQQHLPLLARNSYNRRNRNCVTNRLKWKDYIVRRSQHKLLPSRHSIKKWRLKMTSSLISRSFSVLFKIVSSSRVLNLSRKMEKIYWVVWAKTRSQKSMNFNYFFYFPSNFYVLPVFS